MGHTIMNKKCYPKNRWISNGFMADFYLWSERHHIPFLRFCLKTLLGTQIPCKIPDALFMPHPYGIIVSAGCELGENVVLMQQVTLGGRDPHFNEETLTSANFPKLKEGVYVGAGARILGPVNIGAWAIVGANAVVTKDVPAGATVVGFNKIITKDGE